MTKEFFSPLNKHFVELDDPLATSVNMKVVLNSEASIMVDFDDVPVQAITAISDHFKDLVAKILEEGQDFFDMKRIKTISKIEKLFNVTFHIRVRLSKFEVDNTLKGLINHGSSFHMISCFYPLSEQTAVVVAQFLERPD